MVKHDLVRDGETEARPLRLRREERVCCPCCRLLVDADAVVLDHEGDAFPIAAHGDLDVAAGATRFAGVEEQVHEHLFEHPRVAGDDQTCGRVEFRRHGDTDLGKPMLDETEGSSRQLFSGSLLEAWSSPPSEREKSAYDGIDSTGLRDDERSRAARSFAWFVRLGDLLGARHDHSEGRRYLVCNTRGEGAHGR